MITVMYLFVAWLFTNTVLRSTSPGLGFLQFGDELFLLIALAFLWSVRQRWVLSRELRRILFLLLGIHVLSFVLNMSAVANFVLILVAYAKPIAWAGVLYVLMREHPGFKDRLRKTIVVWCVVQIPLIVVQLLAGEVSSGNYDSVTGTFGPNGGLELGYLAAILACWLIPDLWSRIHRLKAAMALTVAMLTIVASATKQVFLVFGVAFPVHLVVFRLVRFRIIVAATVVVLGLAFGLPAVSPVSYDDYLAGADLLADVTETRKAEGLALTAALFWEHPLYFFAGTGPGMFTSLIALNAETEYARIINYGYFLQKPGESEEGLGGTFNQASSSFLSVIGETGIVGLIAFGVLLTFPFRYLRRAGAELVASQRSLLLILVLGLGCLLQNLLEGGSTIYLFWAMQVTLIIEAEGPRVGHTTS